MRNLQVGPPVETLADLVYRLSYKPGWTFELKELSRRWGSQGLTLCIGAQVPNSLKPEEMVGVYHLMPVPPCAYDEETWGRWLLDQILLVERHEAMEFFTLNGSRPFFPDHCDGRDPYAIAQIKSQEMVDRPAGPWSGGPATDPHFT